MIPTHLRISGFLSYRDPVDLDFNSFDVACISGHNGAGKSSLLDAITWSLFGEARGKSNDVINLHPEVRAAEVIFTFMLEQNTYRVQRVLPRNKSTVLEFQVQNGDSWKPLTEKTTRDTQLRIEQILRLDYDTFVNASFFPAPAGVDVTTPEGMAQAVGMMPTGAFIGLVVGYLVATTLGAYVAARLAASRHLLVASLVAAVFVAGGVANFMMIPHPIWVPIASMLAFLLAPVLALRLAGKPLAS